MRFVPTNCLREGMEIAKTLYGRNSELLLCAGVIVNRDYIESIKRLRYPGVYIHDDDSKNIEIAGIISDDLRNEATKGIKKVFLKAEEGSPQAEKETNLRERVEQIIEELLSHSDMMVNMIDLKCFDNYTYSHSVNVAVLSIIVGISLNLSHDHLVKLGLGALMHDIGKVFVDKEILNKPGRLTHEEFEAIKQHSEFGYKYVKDKFKLPSLSCKAIADHHEKFDGTGYPQGKEKREISLFGRIIAVADIYDALTSERAYRKAINPSESMEYIMSGSGSLFDLEIVLIFIHKVAPYPIGTLVQLSNNWVGLVVENFEETCLRPRVRVLEKDGKRIEPFEIALNQDKNYLNVTVCGMAQVEQMDLF